MNQEKKINLSFFSDRKRIDAFDNVVVKVHLQRQKNNQKVFLVGGTDPKVGASCVARHIAAGLAKSGRKTLLLDADMRKTKADKYGNEQFSAGLEKYLAQNENIDHILYSTNIPLLDILPADQSEAAVQLLCSKKMEELLLELRERYEYIILDIPSFGAVADGSAVLGSVDRVILVTAPKRSYKKQILECCDTIKKYGTELLGVIVNRVDKYGYRDYRKNAGYYEKRENKPDGMNTDIEQKIEKIKKKNRK